MRILEGFLVGVEQVVHFPEFAVGRRGFGHFRGVFGIGMHFSEGKVAEDETEFLAELALDFIDDGGSFPAKGTLVIAVFDEGDRSGLGATDMIACADGQSELTLEVGSHCASSCGDARSSSASRMPSAPGFT